MIYKGLFLSLLFILSGCSNNVNKEEALKRATPIIESILEYKKATTKYPKTLMKIKNFPYKINPLATNGEYYFEDNDDYLYAGGFETGLNPDIGLVYRIRVSFFNSRGSGAITSIFVGFRPDSSYSISYTSMPSAFKQ